mgnify:CR=1 FL=1
MAMQSTAAVGSSYKVLRSEFVVLDVCMGTIYLSRKLKEVAFLAKLYTSG